MRKCGAQNSQWLMMTTRVQFPLNVNRIAITSNWIQSSVHNTLWKSTEKKDIRKMYILYIFLTENIFIIKTWNNENKLTEKNGYYWRFSNERKYIDKG